VDKIYLGTTPSEKDDSPIKYFKGDIAKVIAWNRDLTPTEVENLSFEIPQDGKFLDLDAKDFGEEVNYENVEFLEGDIRIPNSILPHRVEGKMRCLPHKDEGIIGGKFVKGETTARNERRYVLQMQQDKINYKSDGLSTLKYELVGIDQLTPWAKMINIKL